MADKDNPFKFINQRAKGEVTQQAAEHMGDNKIASQMNDKTFDESSLRRKALKGLAEKMTGKYGSTAKDKK